MNDIALPLYEGIDPAAVVLVDSPTLMNGALAALRVADVLGLDTESRPTFAKGEASTGPHLIQLATDTHAYLFPVDRLARADGALDGLREVLESERILKVGFGLQSDTARLRAKLGIELRHVLDLARALRRDGRGNSLGAKTAVALYLGRHLQKSRKVTTSNWARLPLSPSQLRYAADDAQAALRVYWASLGQALPPP